jgi:hypothetical protein
MIRQSGIRFAEKDHAIQKPNGAGSIRSESILIYDPHEAWRRAAPSGSGPGSIQPDVRS